MGEINKKLECDLLMRGGITSGIVYPRAIAKLAETYNFRSIGGTSAGAIAAAATAAAAYAARNGQDFFQTRIRIFPKSLRPIKAARPCWRGCSNRPPGLEPLFGVLMASLQRGGAGWGLISIVLALYRHYCSWAVLGIVLASIPFGLSLWLVWPILRPPLESSGWALGRSFCQP